MAIITRWRVPPDSSYGYWRIRRAGSGMRTSVEQLLGGRLRLAAAHAEVHAQRLADLVTDAHQRVERAHRVLEHHRHRSTPDRAHLPVGAVEQLLAPEADRAASLGFGVADQSHDRAGEHGLAGAGLADDPDRLAALDRQRSRRRPPAPAHAATGSG